MPKTIRSWMVKVGFVALTLCVASGTAFADLTSPFDVAGSTSGQFYVGSTNIALGTSVMGLTFTGNWDLTTPALIQSFWARSTSLLCSDGMIPLISK